MERTYVFGDPSGNGGAANNLLASILPSLQNRGIDTGYLMGLLGNGNGNGALFDFYPRTVSKFVGPRKRSFMPAYLQGFRN